MKRLLSLLLPSILLAAPAQVILITHAEPTPTGNVLSLKGRERAAALTPFFKGSPEVNFNGLPVAIFTSSQLAALTVQPLSLDIDVPIHSAPANLAREILTNPDYEGHTVLVCSPPSDLPALASKLGVKKAPKRWSEEDHDRLWIISYTDEGTATFQNLHQKLLYGDSK